MRVFVTGATGFIGSAVLPELTAAGHQVLALARSDRAAETLARSGVEVQRGELSDLDILASGARACDGVIHLAFIHDFSNMPASAAADRGAIQAIGDALAGSDRPFIVTSGTALLPAGRLGTEDVAADPGSAGAHRVASEEMTLALAERGVRSAVLRLPPSVHGEGDHGFVPALIGIARQKGVSAYIGDGANRWPAVHRLDAAHLYRLVLERGAAGARYHAIDDGGIPIREIAEVIGRHLNLPVVSKSAEEAPEHFGWLGHFLRVDCPASSAQTREQLGWSSTQPGLLADLDAGHYFAG